MLPTSDPNMITPIKLKNTVTPIRYGWSAYRCQPNQYHRQMRTNPITPRNKPSVRLDRHSLRKTFHHSLSFTSCSASERIRIDVACDPEFPPELMISGMNSPT